MEKGEVFIDMSGYEDYLEYSRMFYNLPEEFNEAIATGLFEITVEPLKIKLNKAKCICRGRSVFKIEDYSGYVESGGYLLKYKENTLAERCRLHGCWIKI